MGEESLAAAQQRAEADRQAAMQSGQMGEASLAAAQERAEADRRARIQSGQMTEASLTSAQARAEADRAAGMQSAQMTETSLMNAQQRFESDRQAYLKAAQMGDQSAMQVAKMNMDASRYNQDMLMKQAQEARDQAQMYTGLGDDAQARAYTRIGELERSGATEREMNQRWLDMAYEEEMNRRNFGRENLNWMQGIVSGAPGVLPASQYQKRPAPSFASQMAGFGLGASGLSQMFKS